MTPHQMVMEVRNAYEARDRETFERGLARIESALSYAGPHDARGQPSQHCTRQAGRCHCATPGQREVCMYRRAG